MTTLQVRPSSVVRSALSGAEAGIAATLAMSALMYGAQSLGLLGRAPPRKIVEHGLERLHLRKLLPHSAKTALTALAHLGFGATQGALYALLHEVAKRRIGRDSSPSLATGIPFALAVWATSYAGWTPALDIMPKPQNDRPLRPTVMILAHIVYGATLSSLLRHDHDHHALPEARA